MKKTVSKLQLNRETLHHLIDAAPALRRALGGLESHAGLTCPPVCTLNRPCVP
jgi:hypothetical protein